MKSKLSFALKFLFFFLDRFFVLDERFEKLKRAWRAVAEPADLPQAARGLFKGIILTTLLILLHIFT